AVADARLAHAGAELVDIAVHGLTHGRIHVHLHQEVDAAAQIETEVHGPGVECPQPARRGGSQVEGNGITVAQRLFHQVRRTQLRIGALEPDQEALVQLFGGLDRYPLLLQQIDDTLLHRRRRYFSPGRSDLQRRVFAVQAGQGVDDARQDRKSVVEGKGVATGG